MASMAIDGLIRYFLYVTIFNTFVAVAITAPIIIPQFAFPLKLEVWPGTWMFISYLVFLVVGVLGMLGWGILFFLIKRLSNVESCDRFLGATSLVLMEMSLYALTILMFTAAYVGGSFQFTGIGQSIITYVIGPLVVPMGVSIFIFLIGALMGLMNVVITMTQRTAVATQTRAV